MSRASHQVPFVTIARALVALSLCACDGAITPEEIATETASITVSATPIEREGGTISAGPSSGGIQSTPVVDSTRCPERIPGQGPGNLLGGMCYYPKPSGGCTELGSDCRDVYGDESCRCSAQPAPGGLTGTIPQDQPL